MADRQTVEERAAERAARKQKNARARRAYRAKQKTKRAEARAAAPPAEPDVREHGPGRPKVRQGIVVSAKPDKTITVRIDVSKRHRVYKKIVRSSSTLLVPDRQMEGDGGGLVRVVESRPISRTKRWRLVEVL